MNTRASVSCEGHLSYKDSSHPLEIGLTPIIAKQQYTKSAYSQNKNGIGSSPDSFQAITLCAEIESGLTRLQRRYKQAFFRRNFCDDTRNSWHHYNCFVYLPGINSLPSTLWNSISLTCGAHRSTYLTPSYMAIRSHRTLRNHFDGV